MEDKELKALQKKEQKAYEYFTAMLSDSDIRKLNKLIELNLELEKECNQ